MLQQTWPLLRSAKQHRATIGGPALFRRSKSSADAL